MGMHRQPILKRRIRCVRLGRESATRKGAERLWSTPRGKRNGSGQRRCSNRRFGMPGYVHRVRHRRRLMSLREKMRSAGGAKPKSYVVRSCRREGQARGGRLVTCKTAAR